MVDYDLLVGDTLAPFYEDDCPDIVVNTETITYADGLERRVLFISNVFDTSGDYSTSSYIEGIGSTRYAWTWENINCIIDASETPTNCVSVNGTLIYDNPDYPGCFFTPTHELPATAWSIFPNPTNDRLMIQSSERTKRVALYDLWGRQVMQIEHTTTLDFSELAAGAYVLRAWMGEYAPVQRMVVKQ